MQRLAGWCCLAVAMAAVWLGSPRGGLAEEVAQVDLPVLDNLDFEAGEPGETPVGWIVPDSLRAKGFTGVTVEDNPEDGARCALITQDGTESPGGFGNLMRSFDATPYRGQRVRFSAAVRTEAEGRKGAQLWLRVDRAEGKRGFFDNMNDRPILSRQWGRYEIVGEVAEDAQSINLGLMLIDHGKAWLDSVRFEILGSVGEGNEPSRALAGRGLENLQAFTRLLGYVRYFHPSDQAAEADWESLAIAGVRAVEGAASSGELALILERIFRPVAPSLRVYSDTPPPPLEPPAKSDDLEVLSWRHLGVGIDGNPSSTYQSQRIKHPQILAGGAGFLGQFVDVESYRGHRLRLRATARAETVDGEGAVLWFEPVTHEQVIKQPRGIEDGVELGPAWQTFELDLEIGGETESIGLGLQLRTPGKAWLDDVSLMAIEGGRETVLELDNSSLDQGWPGSGPRGWDVWPEVEGLRAQVDKRDPFAGSGAGLLEHDLEQPEQLPDPATPWVVDLGGGVRARIPLALWKDSAGTLPRAEGSVPAPDKPKGFQPNGDDRDTRLAAVVLAWNIFQHFYPYFDVVETDWPATLRQALTNAATDADAAAFLTTLRRLVVDLHDGHGYVSHRSDPQTALLPLRWEWVEGQLVVTEVGAADGERGLEGLTSGSVVVSINGVPAAQALDELVSTISGATPQWRTTSAARRLVATTPETPVALEVRAPSGEVRQVEVSPVRGQGPLTENRPDKISELEPGIVYVDLGRIDDEDFEGALDQLAAARGVVFDLRGYPSKLSPVVLSHLTDEAVSSAQWHVPVVTRPDREGLSFDTRSWNVSPKQPRLGGKVAFLTDGRAISYAETYLGIVEHYGLAEIVGSPTAGTNGNVNPFRLPGGYGVSWTGMKVLKHDGSRHHGVGILPTVPVERTVRGIAEGRDEVLERGMAVVRE